MSNKKEQANKRATKAAKEAAPALVKEIKKKWNKKPQKLVVKVETKADGSDAFAPAEAPVVENAPIIIPHGTSLWQYIKIWYANRRNRKS